MTATTPATPPSRTMNTPVSITAGRDRAAQIILGLCAVGALVATAATVGEVTDTDGAVRVAETWRLGGLPVFAGLFLILAAAPRRMAEHRSDRAAP